VAKKPGGCGTGRRAARLGAELGLGNYPTIGLARARERAERLRGEISGGADPQRERQSQRDALTLAELIDRYMEERVRPKKKPRTIEL
jgi:Arm DNA-binding domain